MVYRGHIYHKSVNCFLVFSIKNGKLLKAFKNKNIKKIVCSIYLHRGVEEPRPQRIKYSRLLPLKKEENKKTYKKVSSFQMYTNKNNLLIEIKIHSLRN